VAREELGCGAEALERRRAADVAGQERPHDRPDERDAAHREGRRLGGEDVGEPARQDRGQAERQRHQHAVDGEDAPPDPVGHDALEPVRRQRPLGAAANVRDEDRPHREHERGRQAEERVPDPERGQRPRSRTAADLRAGEDLENGRSAPPRRAPHQTRTISPAWN
jgi:hypothetical protein